jgi:2-dehydro-3-deoxygluconokinase
MRKGDAMNPAVIVGECMVELSLSGLADAAIGFAGDTFNTAIYLQRLGVQASYATALGRGDPFSDGIVALMAEEGVGRDWLVEIEGRMPGLYAIETDAGGERRFFYWRDASPARDYLRLVDLDLLQRAMNAAPLVYVSAISLAILSEADRGLLTAMLERAAAAGAPVALDTNYRPRLWASPDIAGAAIQALTPVCRYISTSVADLLGVNMDPRDAALAWSSAGAEVVLRHDDSAVEVVSGRKLERLAPPGPVTVIDTTGAGDAFNAGYLSARLQGQGVAGALERGRQLAQAVIGHRGAIIPKTAMPL